MTAIMMAQMASAAQETARLDTTITVGNDDWIDVGTDDTYFIFGYDDNSGDIIGGVGAFGSIVDATFLDGNSVLRTITAVEWTEPSGGVAPDFDDNLYFGLSGTSIPDTDITFAEIEYNGVIYTRASADVYTPSVSATNTFWQWNNVSPNPPTSGVRTFIVRL